MRFSIVRALCMNIGHRKCYYYCCFMPIPSMLMCCCCRNHRSMYCSLLQRSTKAKMTSTWKKMTQMTTDCKWSWKSWQKIWSFRKLYVCFHVCPQKELEKWNSGEKWMFLSKVRIFDFVTCWSKKISKHSFMRHEI